MKVYGELERAQIENLAADPTGADLVAGRMWRRTDTNEIKYYDGSAVRVVLEKDLAQVVTAKDIDGGTASNTSRITVPSAAFATLSGLTRKAGTVVYDTTNNRFLFDNGTDLVELGTGAGGGAFSIISGDNTNFESTVGDWTTYDDGASATPVDGASGSPVVVSIARNTTAANLLNGDAVGLISKTAADGQGEGVSLSSIAVPTFFRGKEMQVRFKYKTLSGYVNNFYRVFAYDQTNNELLNVFNNNGGDGSLAITPTNGAEFTGSIVVPEGAAQVRLIIHATGTDATAFDVAIDDVTWEEITRVNGPVVGPWQEYTPQLLGTGTPDFDTGFLEGQWRQVGDTAQILISAFVNGTPTLPAAVNVEVSFPPNLTRDTSKMPDDNGGFRTLGNGRWLDSGTSNKHIHVNASGSDSMRFTQDTSSVNFVSYNDLAVGDRFSWIIEIPMNELDAGAILTSSQANFQTVQAIAHASGSTANSSFAHNAVEIADYDTVELDTHNTITTGASWTFTAPRSGQYFVSASLLWTNGTNLIADQLYIYKNGGNYATVSASEGVGGIGANGSHIVELAEGDTLNIRVVQQDSTTAARTINTGNTTLNRVSITSLPDFTVFGVSGQTAFEAATSSVETPSTSDTWHSLTGNSVTLSPGVWQLSGSMQYTFSGGSPSYTSLTSAWSTGNGDDTTTNPGILTTQDAGNPSHLVTMSAVNNYEMQMPTVRLTLTSETEIFGVSRAIIGTPSVARIQAFLYAERLS